MGDGARGYRYQQDRVGPVSLQMTSRVRTDFKALNNSSGRIAVVKTRANVRGKGRHGRE